MINIATGDSGDDGYELFLCGGFESIKGRKNELTSLLPAISSASRCSNRVTLTSIVVIIATLHSMKARSGRELKMKER